MAGSERPELASVERLTVVPEGAERPVLDGVELRIELPASVSLLGANGSGKSMLLHALAGLVACRGGHVSLPRPVACVLQDPDVGWAGESVEDEILFALACRGVVGEAARARARGVLGACGLGPLAARDPGDLSVGEKQRVQLAAAIAQSPGTLLLDEPTAFLDPAEAARFDALVDAARPAPRLVLLATHDLERALTMDRVLLLDHGRIVAHGTPEEVVDDPAWRASGVAEPPARIAARAIAATHRALEPEPYTWAALARALGGATPNGAGPC